ncbi:energy transducer TonB [Pseudoxanthomonas sp. JBR18]|uniref:energy transducer TonB n=1 Tax=Pseudoxanthomonas sp. JBR18 TaxID=2969308 RepID=UPI002305ECF9|nr:energy transducer TonB [Pseudoxanthomonas sp. JBR18]WCE03592.1 energy transducer TonB [Pseudoxanthomonas sp. JBR18]
MIVLEQDRQTLRWGASLGLVLAAHAAIIAAALWWSSYELRQSPPEPAEAVMVELAPLPSAPPAPPTDLAPGPPQQEQRQTQPKVQPEPTSEPEPQQKPQERADVALPQPVRERQNEENANTNVSQTSAPPNLQAPPDARYAARQSLSGISQQAMVTWQAQLLGHLEKFKRYPRAAQRRRYEGAVLVQYAVDRQGKVLSVRLATSSGHELLDAEAVAAVQRASPLPPPPTDIPGNPVEVSTPIDFFLR